MSRKLLNLLAKPRNLNRIRSSVGRKSDWIATRSYATGPVGAGPESAVEGRAKSIVGVRTFKTTNSDRSLIQDFHFNS